MQRQQARGGMLGSPSVTAIRAASGRDTPAWRHGTHVLHEVTLVPTAVCSTQGARLAGPAKNTGTVLASAALPPTMLWHAGSWKDRLRAGMPSVESASMPHA